MHRRRQRDGISTNSDELEDDMGILRIPNRVEKKYKSVPIPNVDLAQVEAAMLRYKSSAQMQ